MKRTLFSILALTLLASSLPEVHSQSPIKRIHKPVVKHHWVLDHEDTQPTIRSNSEILLCWTCRTGGPGQQRELREFHNAS